jgi:hypothetical protein
MYRGEPPQDIDSKYWSSSLSMRNNRLPIGPYLYLVGIQGASSTPAGTAGAYNFWICWTISGFVGVEKKQPRQMLKHPLPAIQGI